jgi:hypothetical protein
MDAKEGRRKKDRELYARMTDEEKQEKLKRRREAYQQNKKNKDAQKSGVTSKEKIAMVNPACIATEQEGGTSTIHVSQRKHVTPGERQTLLNHRNEEFSAKQRKPASVSPQEDTAMMNNNNTGIETSKNPEMLTNGNTLNFIKYQHIQK